MAYCHDGPGLQLEYRCTAGHVFRLGAHEDAPQMRVSGT